MHQCSSFRNCSSCLRTYNNDKMSLTVSKTALTEYSVWIFNLNEWWNNLNWYSLAFFKSYFWGDGVCRLKCCFISFIWSISFCLRTWFETGAIICKELHECHVKIYYSTGDSKAWDICMLLWPWDLPEDLSWFYRH